MAGVATASWSQLGKAKLASSGIPMELSAKLGMREVASAVTLSKSFTALPALVLEYHNLRGNPIDFYRVRYLATPKDFSATTSKAQRYAQPAGSGTHAYFPTTENWTALAVDTSRRIMITEGELKAAAACYHGYPTIGLGGVWNFRASERGIWFLKELEEIKWAQRDVLICYDSDAHTNPNVALAINKLAEELEERGAYTFVVMLPEGEDGAKVGLDDYFLEHDTADFAKLVLAEAQPLGVTTALWRVNDEVVYVEDPGMVCVLDTTQKMNPSAFKEHSRWSTNSALSKVLDKDGNVTAKKVPAAPIWLRWPLRRAATAITYAPGAPRITNANEFNQWRGWGCVPRKGNSAPFTKLCEFIFSETEKGALEWFYDWIAYPIQNPGVKLYSDVLIHSRMTGNGKSLIGYTLGEVYGGNFQEITNTDLEGAYTSWAENKQFVLGDEITGSDKRERGDLLKRLVTQRSITINTKYVPQYTVPDCINYLWTSQHPDAFFLDDEDRRHFIIEAPHDKLSLSFYKEYDEWLWRGEGPGAVFQWLLDRKIRDFSPTGPAFLTKAKDRMILAGKGDLAAWVKELKDHPDQVLRFGAMRHQRDLFTSRELLDLFTAQSATVNPKLTAMGVANKLSDAGLPQVLEGAPLRGPDGRLARYFAVRNWQVWKKARSRTLMEKNIALPPVKGPAK